MPTVYPNYGPGGASAALNGLTAARPNPNRLTEPSTNKERLDPGYFHPPIAAPTPQTPSLEQAEPALLLNSLKMAFQPKGEKRQPLSQPALEG